MKKLLVLWPFFRTYKSSLIIMMTCGFCMSLLQGTAAPIGAYLFDRIFAHSTGMDAEKLSIIDQFYAATTGTEQETLVYAVPLTLVLIYFLNGIFRYFHFFLMRYTGDCVSNDLRQALQKKYLSLNLSFHQNYSAGSGGLLSRTMSDVFVIQNSTGIMADLLREPILAIYLFALMIYMDWKLTVSILLIAPILVIFLQKISKSLRKYGHRHQEALESLMSTLKESLDGVKVIQSFGLEEKIFSKFRKQGDAYLLTRKRIVAREEVSGPVSETIGVFVFALMAIYCGLGIIRGEFSAGVFVSFILAMGLMQKPVKKIQDALIRLQQAIASTERVFAILNDENTVPRSNQPKPFPKDWQKIAFKNIHFSYDEGEKILDGIDLEVQRGEIVALVGSSGSGKSTLVNLIERFFDPTHGEIRIGDSPVKDISLEELRRHIALVTQDVFLFNDTIEGNIRDGNLNLKNTSVEEAAKIANAHEFVSKLPNGYQTTVGERGNQLSGGEKQRVSIARAVFKDAPILILDEATSALDSVSEIEVQKGLEQLMQGRTTFVIAHRLSTVKKADRIVVLSKGRVVEIGNHDSLLAKDGAYADFHRLQMQGEA